ncbi:MAG TPA: VWA domain-containing protein [Candidatus Sulfotelmatobacter sp.]|nr:VWA domain-containing protein [Candidatus Sulfotelmatobacter sp.]
MRIKRIHSRLYTLVFAAASLAFCQDPQSTSHPAADASDDATKISVKVNVVNVLATVRDKHGKIVNDLTKDDFSLAEDGRPQSIHYFSRETDLPLTLGLLVDTSLSQRRVLDQERSASHSFLDQMVRADRDKAFIIHFDREVELLQDLTSSHQKLEEALGALRTPEYTQTGSNGGGGNWPGGGHGGHHGGGTMLYDAVFLASDELMRKQEGRKALVLLTDGVDTGSKENLDAAIESAQRANTLVYSILFKDNEAYGRSGGFARPTIGFPGGGGHRGGGQRYPTQPRPDGKKILERISRETGGRFFEVSNKKPIDQIYSEITEELRNQYNLGYTPDREASNNSSYHKIQLTAKQKDLTVQARDGYYANTEASPSATVGQSPAAESR